MFCINLRQIMPKNKNTKNKPIFNNSLTYMQLKLLKSVRLVSPSVPYKHDSKSNSP